MYAEFVSLSLYVPMSLCTYTLIYTFLIGHFLMEKHPINQICCPGKLEELCQEFIDQTMSNFGHQITGSHRLCESSFVQAWSSLTKWAVMPFILAFQLLVRIENQFSLTFPLSLNYNFTDPVTFICTNIHIMLHSKYCSIFIAGS